VLLTNLAERLAAPYPSLLAIAGACLAFLPFAPHIAVASTTHRPSPTNALAHTCPETAPHAS
jgi:hypothetical protein